MITKEMDVVAKDVYKEGTGYLKTITRKLEGTSKFNNDLLYSMSVMCCEKLFVAHIAKNGFMAEHHMPLALFNEAASLDPKLPIEFKDTAKLIGRFESICSLDGFGYKTPTDEELTTIIAGLIEINKYVYSKF